VQEALNVLRRQVMTTILQARRSQTRNLHVLAAAVHRKVLPGEMQERGDLGPSPNDAVGSSSHFKWVLGAVFIITLLALVALVALVFAPLVRSYQLQVVRARRHSSLDSRHLLV
jgi:hypothetical protein